MARRTERRFTLSLPLAAMLGLAVGQPRLYAQMSPDVSNRQFRAVDSLIDAEFAKEMSGASRWA